MEIPEVLDICNPEHMSMIDQIREINELKDISNSCDIICSHCSQPMVACSFITDNFGKYVKWKCTDVCNKCDRGCIEVCFTDLEGNFINLDERAELLAKQPTLF